MSPSLAFDSPLDLKIKGNLVKDAFNLVGVRKPSSINPTDLSQVNYPAYFCSSKARTKKSFEEKQAQIAAELVKQFKDQEGFNWIQKEYFCQFI